MMKGRILRLWHHGMVQNALALYAAQFATFLLPLVTVPYLARVLGPESLGNVAFAQALGLFVMLVVEYSFYFSATREVARHRESPARLSEILAGVTAAKLVLAVGCLGLAGIAQLLVPSMGSAEPFVWVAVLWGTAYAFRPLWFFLGMESVRVITLVDIAAKGLAVVGIFYFVRGPGDGLATLLLQAGGAVLSTSIATYLAYRKATFQRPTLAMGWKALRMGWSVFVFNAAVSLYTKSNVFLLGFLMPTQYVGFYSGAEKINRTAIGFMGPISEALFPHTSNVAHQSHVRASRIIRFTVVTMGLGGMIAGIVAYVAAPLVIRVALGTGYETSIPIFRVLAILLPILGVSIPLATQWMIPIGMEATLSKISLSAGVIHIPLAIFMVSFFGVLGAAYAIVTTEIYVIVAICAVLVRRGLNPFSRQLALRSSISSPAGRMQDAM
jgi:PST family polysaccharide transporter